jgi:hypothetical protein
MASARRTAKTTQRRCISLKRIAATKKTLRTNTDRPTATGHRTLLAHCREIFTTHMLAAFLGMEHTLKHFNFI